MSHPRDALEVVRPDATPMTVTAASFVIQERAGSGAPWLHVHEMDDEAWYVLEGHLRFRTPDRTVDARAGEVVYVPAGTVHTYEEVAPSRYLLILTPSLAEMLVRLHDPKDTTPVDELLAEYHTWIEE
jgi:mannose-6-phosphate isomerase-like protein (cupin superfamily)